MIELWTNRVTIWRHESCMADERLVFCYPESERGGPNDCPLCGALLCGCCNVATPIETFTSDWLVKFVRESGARNYQLVGYV